MIEPRPIALESVPRAIERVKHYRLLNEPAQAESICRDIVAVQPDNQEAWINLLLSLTDQFPSKMTSALESAKEALGQIQGDFEQAYYQGIVHERWGRANSKQGQPGSAAGDWIRKAMRYYQQAMELASSDDPDPTLRWNTCARFLNEIPADQRRPAHSLRDMHAEYEEVPRRQAPGES